MEDAILFPEWFKLFTEKCRSMGYNGPIDADSARIDWINDLSPDEAAELFVAEMNA